MALPAPDSNCIFVHSRAACRNAPFLGACLTRDPQGRLPLLRNKGSIHSHGARDSSIIVTEGTLSNMEMTEMKPRPAAPMDTKRVEKVTALHRNELPDVPSHDFTVIQHSDPRASHVPRVPLVINTLQPNPNSASVSKSAAANGGTPQTDILEVMPRTPEPVITRVDNEPRPDLYHGPVAPESQHNRSHFDLTAAKDFEQAPKITTHQNSAQDGASDVGRYDVPQPSSLVLPSPLAVHGTDIPKYHQMVKLLSSKTYVVVEEEPWEETRKKWENDARHELNGWLNKHMKLTSTCMLTTRLCMAYMKADKERVAKPVVIIDCNTKKCGKLIRKYLSEEPSVLFLKKIGVSVSITIANLGFSALSDEDTPVGAPESLVPKITIGTDGTVGDTKHKSHRSTYCGRNLRIEVWQDGLGKPSFATFGGVVSIKGSFYGITAAHSFLLNLRHSPEWELFEGEREAVLSTISTSTSPSTSVDTDSVTDDEPCSIANALQTPWRAGEDFVSLVYLKPLSTMAYSFQGMTLRPGGTPMPDTSMSDWALFPLQTSVALPNSYETRLLTSIVPESQLMAGPVSILLGIDASCDGYLTSPTASLHTEHALMDVREIMLKSTLPKGASGAWVVRGAKVCGYVVALIGGLSCLMIPMERTFREIKELFHDDVEFGLELHERIEEHHPVDGVVESLIAATQRAGEALEVLGQNIKLHSGVDPDSITALREFQHQGMASDPSHKAGLGTDPEEAIDPAIRPLSDPLRQPTWNKILDDASHVSMTCGSLSRAFINLTLRSRSERMKLAHKTTIRFLFDPKTLDRLCSTIAQHLNMLELAWGCIRDRPSEIPKLWLTYDDMLQRSLSITRNELEILQSISMCLFPAEYPSVGRAMLQSMHAILWKGRLKEHQRRIKSLADDAKYLQDQCRLPANQTTA